MSSKCPSVHQGTCQDRLVSLASSLKPQHFWTSRRPTIRTMGQLLSQERLGTLPRATRVKNTILYGSKIFCWGLHFISCQTCTCDAVQYFQKYSFFVRGFLCSHSLLHPTKLQFSSVCGVTSQPFCHVFQIKT